MLSGLAYAQELDPGHCKNVTLESGNKQGWGADWKASYWYTPCGNHDAKRGTSTSTDYFSLMGEPKVVSVVAGTRFEIGQLGSSLYTVEEVMGDIKILCKGNVLPSEGGEHPGCKPVS